LKSNNIQTVYDSHSDLGVCGISYDVLFTQIEWIGGDLEDMLSQGSVSKEYTELIKYYDEEINFNQNGGGLASKDCSDLITPLQMLVNSTVDLYREVFDNPQFESQKIDLNDIQYFKVEGTVHYVSNVSGGGVNLHGAAAGAILAGGAAAVMHHPGLEGAEKQDTDDVADSIKTGETDHENRADHTFPIEEIEHAVQSQPGQQNQKCSAIGITDLLSGDFLAGRAESAGKLFLAAQTFHFGREEPGDHGDHQ
jgi:hypothetical protein